MTMRLCLDDELVRKVRKIAVERGTTLANMIRDYLEKLASERTLSGRRHRERAALECSFEHFQFKL
jgi:hypothetical protein